MLGSTGGNSGVGCMFESGTFWLALLMTWLLISEGFSSTGFLLYAETSNEAEAKRTHKCMQVEA